MPATYLHIRGTLADNMVYEPSSGHESSRPGSPTAGDPTYQLVLLDREDRVLVTATPDVRGGACRVAGSPVRRRVRGVLPLHPDGSAYELRCGLIRLHRAAIPASPPTLKAPSAYPNANGTTLRWQAASSPVEPPCESAGQYSASAQRTTYSVVALMASGRRITLARGLTELAHAVDLSRIPVSGPGTLYLVATDGVRSTEVEAAHIDVPARAPTLHILSPAPDARLPFGQPVSVLGCCLDMGGQPYTPSDVEWSIDRQVLAAGSLIAALSDLEPGRHRLTLSCRHDEGAEPIQDSLSFDIDEPDADYQVWESLVGNADVNRAGNPPNDDDLRTG